MKAFVGATGVEFGKAFFSFSDYRYCNLTIGLFFHYVMMQDELILVFQDAYLTPSSTGTPALPLFIHSAFSVFDVAFNFNLLEQLSRCSRGQFG